MTSGVTLKPLVLRATEISEDDEFGTGALLRRTTLSLAPVIEVGKTFRNGCGCVVARAPDQFKHFEIEIKVPWYRAPFIRFRSHYVALEFWTEDPVDARQWIHWLFPYSTLKRKKLTVFRGETFAGEPVHHDEVPDGQSIASGGFWKTNHPPPRA